MEHSSDIAQVQECVWKAYHLLSIVLDSPCDPTKEMVWMTRAVQNLSGILQAVAKYPAIYIPWLLIAASRVFSSGDIHLAPKDLIWLDTPGLEQDQWDDKWWLALAPQQEDNAPVEGKGKGKVTNVELVLTLAYLSKELVALEPSSLVKPGVTSTLFSLFSASFHLSMSTLSSSPMGQMHLVQVAATHTLTRNLSDTEQPMEAPKIKMLPIKKQKQAGEDEESEDGEEEAEGSGSIGTLIFELLMLTTPPMDPATPAEMEEEGDKDPITMMPTPSPPHKKAHCVWVRMPSPLTLSPGPVPSTSTSTFHLALAGGSTSTTASAAPPTLLQPCQPVEGNCAYVLVDTFQQVLMWEHMTWLECEMAKMATTMCCWWDNIISDYLKLNQHIMTMEENQHKFINQPFMNAIQLFYEDLITLEQRVMHHDLDIWLGISQLEQNTHPIGHMVEVVHTLSRQHHDQGTQTWMDEARSSGSHSTASNV
ncbi:hypothetical protein ID866_11021 [Astraeus odoratus]|nr:hypothetical protein ID866_11021 [Astraeus odoratus]